jgi:hypothetical protein
MTPALSANDRNAAEFFARVCVNNLGKYRPVEALARSEKWARAPVGQVPSGMPRPSRVKAWLVEIARKPVIVVVGTVKIGGVNIDSCTVVGPATRSSVNAVIKAYRAKEVATYSDANGTAKSLLRAKCRPAGRDEHNGCPGRLLAPGDGASRGAR